MIFINKKSAVKAYCLLAMADGIITGAELDRLRSIGKETDPENFDKYGDALISDCWLITATSAETRRNGMLTVEIDEALKDTVDSETEGIPAGLLLWNMLVISYADGVCVESEKRLAMHTAERLSVDFQVISQMDELILAGHALEKELNFIGKSGLPDAEKETLEKETQKRLSVILQAAAELAADGWDSDIPTIEIKEDIFDRVGNYYYDKALPAIQNTDDKLRNAVESAVSETVDKVENTTEKLENAARKKIDKAIDDITSAVKPKSGKGKNK